MKTLLKRDRPSKYTKAFIEYIQEYRNNLGKNIYINLKKLFVTKASMREYIQLINKATLDRARG
jgi:hypothetical protein